MLVSFGASGVRVGFEFWAGMGARTSGHAHLHAAVFLVETGIGSANLTRALFPKGYTVAHSSGREIRKLVVGLVSAGLCYGGKGYRVAVHVMASHPRYTHCSIKGRACL